MCNVALHLIDVTFEKEERAIESSLECNQCQNIRMFRKHTEVLYKRFVSCYNERYQFAIDVVQVTDVLNTACRVG